MVERLRTSFSDRRLAVLGALVGLSGLVAGLVAFRIAYSHSFEDVPYLWNLFLAWIPFGLALLIYDRHRRGTRLVQLLALGLIWLLFLPNAPYIVTDFKYLGDMTGKTFWFEGLLIGTAAITGLLLGFISLYLIQAIVRRIAGAPYAWLFVFVSLGLRSLRPSAESYVGIHGTSFSGRARCLVSSQPPLSTRSVIRVRLRSRSCSPRSSSRATRSSIRSRERAHSSASSGDRPTG